MMLTTRNNIFVLKLLVLLMSLIIIIIIIINFSQNFQQRAKKNKNNCKKVFFLIKYFSKIRIRSVIIINFRIIKKLWILHSSSFQINRKEQKKAIIMPRSFLYLNCNLMRNQLHSMNRLLKIINVLNSLRQPLQF